MARGGGSEVGKGKVGNLEVERHNKKRRKRQNIDTGLG